MSFLSQSSGIPKVLMTWLPLTTLKLSGFSYNTNYKCSKLQSLYYASDMTDIGLVAGGQIFGMAARLSISVPSMKFCCMSSLSSLFFHIASIFGYCHISPSFSYSLSITECVLQPLQMVIGIIELLQPGFRLRSRPSQHRFSQLLYERVCMIFMQCTLLAFLLYHVS